LTFFGLSNQHREIWESEILELVCHSEGTFSYWDIYHMPVSYRKSALKWIIKDIDNRNKEASKQKGEMSLEDMVNKVPKIPDYAVNA
jgi:hypothetical protein